MAKGDHSSHNDEEGHIHEDTGWRPQSAPQKSEPNSKQSGKNSTVLLKGVVVGFQQHTETKTGFSQKQQLVWNFHVECYDPKGKLIHTIPVKMSGDGFDGAINNGDEVQVSGWKKGTLLRTDRVKNLTSQIEVRAIHRLSQSAINWIVFLLFIMIVFFLMIMNS